MLQTGNNPELDESVWQAWIKKNAAQDKVRFARRVRVIGFVTAIVAVSALLWRLV